MTGCITVFGGMRLIDRHLVALLLRGGRTKFLVLLQFGKLRRACPNLVGLALPCLLYPGDDRLDGHPRIWNELTGDKIAPEVNTGRS